jgi:hypothetical protein
VKRNEKNAAGEQIWGVIEGGKPMRAKRIEDEEVWTGHESQTTRVWEQMNEGEQGGREFAKIE